MGTKGQHVSRGPEFVATPLEIEPQLDKDKDLQYEYRLYQTK